VCNKDFFVFPSRSNGATTEREQPLIQINTYAPSSSSYFVNVHYLSFLCSLAHLIQLAGLLKRLVANREVRGKIRKRDTYIEGTWERERKGRMRKR